LLARLSSLSRLLLLASVSSKAWLLLLSLASWCSMP
jgi:hypothetical protein